MGLIDDQLRAAGASQNGHRWHEPVEFEVVYGDIAQVRRTRWAWESWAPLGSLVIIAGEPGAGKGVLISWVLARLSRGTCPGDLYGQPCRALWVGFEDSWEEVVLPRLIAADADVDMIGHLRPKTPGEMLELARDHERLRGLVREHGLQVIAFEAIVDHLAGTDDHKNAEVRRALTPLVELARSEHLLVIGTTHLNKMSTGTYRQRVSGSGGYLAVARVGLLVHPHPEMEDQRVLALGKGNLGKVPPALAFEIVSADVSNPDGSEVADVGVLAREYRDESLTVDELLASRQPDHGSRGDDVSAWIRELLTDGPMRSNDVYAAGDQVGFAKVTIKRHKDAAGVQTYREDGVWWMRLGGPTSG